MKQQKEFYAIATDNNNAKTTDDIRCALIFEKGHEKSEKAVHNIAEAVGGRLVKIKAEYEITEEDGSELQEPDESIGKCDHDAVDSFSKKMSGL